MLDGVREPETILRSRSDKQLKHVNEGTPSFHGRGESAPTKHTTPETVKISHYRVKVMPRLKSRVPRRSHTTASDLMAVMPRLKSRVPRR